MALEVRVDKLMLNVVGVSEVAPLDTYSTGPGTSIQLLLLEAIRYCKRKLAGLPVKMVDV